MHFWYEIPFKPKIFNKIQTPNLGKMQQDIFETRINDPGHSKKYSKVIMKTNSEKNLKSNLVKIRKSKLELMKNKGLSPIKFNPSYFRIDSAESVIKTIRSKTRRSSLPCLPLLPLNSCRSHYKNYELNFFKNSNYISTSSRKYIGHQQILQSKRKSDPLIKEDSLEHKKFTKFVIFNQLLSKSTKKILETSLDTLNKDPFRFTDYLKRKAAIGRLKSKEQIKQRFNERNLIQLQEVYRDAYCNIGIELRNDFIDFINRNFGKLNKNKLDSQIKEYIKRNQGIKINYHKTQEEIINEKNNQFLNKISRKISPQEKRRKMSQYSKKLIGFK